MFTRAILRRPGPDFADGLTTAGLGRPDLALLQQQHAAYAEALRRLALQVEVLPPLEGFPDSTFVEDVTVITPEVAVITRPGAPSRRGEAEPMAPILARHRPLARIEAPGTLDGGDVLIVGRTVLVGLSSRTNAEGAGQLGSILRLHGYALRTVPVGAGLHFKSSVNAVGDGCLLVSPGFEGREELRGHRQIVVEAAEAHASNALLINGTLLMAAGFPSTRRRLEALGAPIVELDVSELRKMDGGLTCLSLRF